MTSTLARPTTRRTLVRGAAWSVPVVSLAAAAPAFAASCTPQAFSTMNLVSKIGSDGTTVSVASTLVGGALAGSFNLSTNDPAFPTPGWLELENRPRATTETSPAIYQDVKFTFDQSVSLLQFTVSDIDTFAGGGGGNHTYWDRVAIITPPATPFAATPVVAGNTAVSGSGTLADPLRQTNFTAVASTPNDATNRQMRISFSGSTTEVTVRFWTSVSNGNSGTHAVWIGNMVYKTGCTV